MDNSKIQISINTIVKGSVIVLGGTAVGHFLNFLFKMIAARHFGPEDYGWFSMGLAVLVIGAGISGLGMNQSVARFIPFFKEKGEQNKLSYTITFGAKLSFFVSLILGLTIIIVSPWLSEMLHGKKDFTLFLMLFALVVPFEVIFDYSLGILRGMKDMRMMALCNNIILWVIRIVLLSFIVFINSDIKWMVIPYFVSYAVGLTVSWRYIIKRMPISWGSGYSIQNFNVSILRKELLAYSLPLVFSTITTMFRKRFDIILVGFFLTASQVGLYNAALPLAMLMTVFLFAVNRIAMPVASELLGSGSEKEMEYVYKSIAKWSLMAALPMFFILFFYPQKIISFFFGKEYMEAANVLRILAVGFFVNSISGSFGEFLQSYGKTWPIFIISVTGTILNLTLMAILIPKFGIEGAAFAFASSLLWMCLLGNICMYHYKRILPFSREYLKAIVLGTVIFTGGYLLQTMLVKTVTDNYIFTGGIAVMSLLIYLPVLYIFTLNEFDRQILLRIRRKFHIAPKTAV